LKLRCFVRHDNLKILSKTIMNSLKGKTALVTGGGKGIGRGIAICLAEEGANVAVVSRTHSEVRRVAQELSDLGVDSLAIQSDISKEREVKRVAQKTADRWGSIHILVNNAALFGKGEVIGLNKRLWDSVLATNLTGPFLCCRAVLPFMVKQKWGRIINISSAYGKMPRLGNSAYNTSKLGLIGFTRVLALETTPYNITINSICPGWVETDHVLNFINSESKKTGKPRDLLMNQYKKESPQNRWISPREIGRLVVYLASDEANSITGEDINISGGMVMY